jgi:FKBP-type peptidyl-prolyl cis-trans isomerase
LQQEQQLNRAMTPLFRIATRACQLCLAAGALTGCIGGSLTAPECTPVPFSQASVQADTITTTTGLRYIEGEAGIGTPLDWCRQVAIHYDAFLLDGTKFDSSREENPLIFVPGIGDLIDGIEQGVIGMRTDGSRRLIIPPALAFGSTPRRDGSGQIIVPGNSTVVYDIEIVGIGQ